MQVASCRCIAYGKWDTSNSHIKWLESIPLTKLNKFKYHSGNEEKHEILQFRKSKSRLSQKLRKYRSESSIPFWVIWVIFPFRRFFIMNAWQHHPNMAFLDSASSLCCHESVSVRWLNLSWSWPHFAVQSGRATTSLYPQLHIALKPVTGPSEEPRVKEPWSRTFLERLWTLQSMLLASPSVLNAWGTHQRGGLTWSCSAAKSRDCICHSSRHLSRQISETCFAVFFALRRKEKSHKIRMYVQSLTPYLSMWINKIVCVWMLWIKSKNIIINYFHSNDEILYVTHLTFWKCEVLLKVTLIHPNQGTCFGPTAFNMHGSTHWTSRTSAPTLYYLVFFRARLGPFWEHLSLQIFTPRIVVQ